MTVPAPRGDSTTNGGTDSAVLQTVNYVAQTLDQLVGSTERGFREMRETLANNYVPRNEIDRRFDDTNLDVAALGARIKATEDRAAQEARDRQARLEQNARDREADETQAARDREAAASEAARDRRVDRWQKAGLAIGAAVSLIGSTGLLQHVR